MAKGEQDWHLLSVVVAIANEQAFAVPYFARATRPVEMGRIIGGFDGEGFC